MRNTQIVHLIFNTVFSQLYRYIKIRYVCSMKANQKYASAWDKVFAIHISIKRLGS